MPVRVRPLAASTRMLPARRGSESLPFGRQVPTKASASLWAPTLHVACKPESTREHRKCCTTTLAAAMAAATASLPVVELLNT
jgi:hypothetical protein